MTNQSVGSAIVSIAGLDTNANEFLDELIAANRGLKLGFSKKLTGASVVHADITLRFDRTISPVEAGALEAELRERAVAPEDCISLLQTAGSKVRTDATLDEFYEALFALTPTQLRGINALLERSPLLARKEMQ